MQKILIIQTAFLGDVILSTSVLEKLHQFYPNAKIDFLLRKGNESVLHQHPYLHNVLIWEKQKKKYSHLFQLLKKIRREKYDAVINLQRFASTGILTGFSNAKYRIGFSKNPFSFLFTHKYVHSIGNGKHETERNLELIKEITDSQIVQPKLYTSEKDEQYTARYKTNIYICVAPISIWHTKQFPQTKWMELLSKIHSDYKIYLLGSKEDKKSCDEIMLNSKQNNIINLAGELTVIQTASLMKDAVMNYVNDSAPLHIASAMNAPVTAIFCSTLSSFGFGPLSENATIIETKENLNCRPCGLHGKKKCPESHFKCAFSINIEQFPLLA